MMLTVCAQAIAWSGWKEAAEEMRLGSPLRLSANALSFDFTSLYSQNLKTVCERERLKAFV